MRKLDRYISATILSAIMMVLVVVLALDAIASVIDQSEDIKNNYTYSEVLIFVALTLPGRLYDYLPFASLVGCLAGLGSLANNSELVVMRAAGISIRRLVWSVMKPAMIVMLAGVLLGEYIAPASEKMAVSRQSIMLHGGEKTISSRGLWNREGQQYMHFNAVEPGGVLHGVTIYKFNQEGVLNSAMFARRGTYVEKGVWLLEEVAETLIVLDEGSSLRKYETLRWKTKLSPELLNYVMLDSDDLSIRGLWDYAHYLGEQGLNNSEYWLSFWKKTLNPLATASLVLIAISFVFGPLREVTMGQRIFSGVMIGIIFQTSQDMLGPASMVFGFAPIYAALGPILLCLALGIYLLSRVR